MDHLDAKLKDFKLTNIFQDQKKFVFLDLSALKPYDKSCLSDQDVVLQSFWTFLPYRTNGVCLFASRTED